MDLYEEIVRLRQTGRRGALATIVNVRGSIPSFIANDISLQRNAERELLRAKEAARWNSCAKSQSLANISHELAHSHERHPGNDGIGDGYHAGRRATRSIC